MSTATTFFMGSSFGKGYVRLMAPLVYLMQTVIRRFVLLQGHLVLSTLIVLMWE